MTATETAQILPLLPLSSGVVLPGMVVTLALESGEAQAAASAAEAADRTLVLVPRRARGGFADVGTVARIEDVGALPTGQRAAVVRGLRRAHLGAGTADRAAGPPRGSRPVRSRAARHRRRPTAWPASCGPRSRSSSTGAAPPAWSTCSGA